MSTLKPCSYCGQTTFQYLPNVILDSAHVTTVMGIRSKIHNAGEWWVCTLVACTNCGNTMIFTTNVQELGQRVPGAKIIQAGQ